MSSRIKDLATHPDRFVKPMDLAQYWNVHEATVYRAIEKGSLPAARIGRAVRVSREDALRFEGSGPE